MCLTFILEIAISCTGLRAAYLWYKASIVKTDQTLGTDPGVTDEWKAAKMSGNAQGQQSSWNAAFIKSTAEQSGLNAEAALWTGGSVFLGAVMAVVQIIWNP